MFKSPTAKRIRAIFFALLITFASNYAISYAAKSADRSGATGGNHMPGVIPPGRSGATGGNHMPGVIPPGRSGATGGNHMPGVIPPGAPAL